MREKTNNHVVFALSQIFIHVNNDIIKQNKTTNKKNYHNTKAKEEETWRERGKKKERNLSFKWIILYRF